MTDYFATSARLPDGWASDVRIRVSANGHFERIERNSTSSDATVLDGAVLPAMPNCHSHSFQRAMAGATEYRHNGNDDFWSWREAMYATASRMSADALYAIALRAFVEMLKAGYTTVAEFHYLHTIGDGCPIDSANVLRRAATGAGIRLLLLPTLYQRGGFDDAELTQAQSRFRLSNAEILALIDDLLAGQNDGFRVGLAIHSLRAVTPEALGSIISEYQALNADGPLHIHVAEQTAEVDACLARTGRRPIDWLLENHEVDERWTLVHATHASTDELARLADTDATVCLCPTTEANLGDGLFAAHDWLERGGRICVGSDSNVSIDPVEELRWLEYGQRLRDERRNVLAGDGRDHVGDRLWEAAVAGGAASCRLPIGGLEVGAHADMIVVATDHPLLAQRTGAAITDSLIFAGNERLVKDVMVSGRWVVRHYTHPDEAHSRTLYRDALAQATSSP